MGIVVGCSAQPGGGIDQPLPHNTGHTTSVAADFDDVDAAVNAVLPRHEMALLRSETFDGTIKRYEAVSIEDWPVLIIATRADESVQLRCAVGRFGRAGTETALLNDIQARLEQLAGVDTSPLRSP